MTKLLDHRGAAYFAAVLCTLLWGTAFPFIKLGYEAFEIDAVGSRLLFAGARFFIAGFMVFAVGFALRRKPLIPHSGDLRPILLLGLVQTAAQYIFTYIGIGLTSGANTSIITACASFFTVLGAAIFFKSDRLNIQKLLGCAVGFAGVLIVNTKGGFSPQTLLGDALILCSTVSAAAGNLIAKKQMPGRDPATVTAWQLMLGGAVLTFTGIINGGRLSLNLRGIMILLWLALVSAAAFTIWTALLKRYAASKISIFNLLVPVFGTLLSGVMLGEDVFRIEIFISAALISAGIVLVNYQQKSKQ